MRWESKWDWKGKKKKCLVGGRKRVSNRLRVNLSLLAPGSAPALSCGCNILSNDLPPVRYTVVCVILPAHTIWLSDGSLLPSSPPIFPSLNEHWIERWVRLYRFESFTRWVFDGENGCVSHSDLKCPYLFRASEMGSFKCIVSPKLPYK